MKALIQRVSHARVDIGDETVGAIDSGLMVLLGVCNADTADDVSYLARRLISLRIFEDDDGRMNRSVTDTAGSILLISQFTLYADTRKGNRPSFVRAGDPSHAEALYAAMTDALRDLLPPDRVASGRFGANMQVHLCNDGPVTIELSTDHRRPPSVPAPSPLMTDH